MEGTTSGAIPPLELLTPFRQNVGRAGDLLAAVVIVLCIPFVIMAFGLPLVLLAQLIKWIGSVL